MNPQGLEVIKAIFSVMSLAVTAGLGFFVYRKQKRYEAQRIVFSKILALSKIFPQCLHDFNYSLIQHRFFTAVYNRIDDDKKDQTVKDKYEFNILNSYNYYDKQKDKARELLIAKHQELLENIGLISVYFVVSKSLKSAIDRFLEFDGYTMTFMKIQPDLDIDWVKMQRDESLQEVRRKISDTKGHLSAVVVALEPLVENKPEH